MALSLQRPVVGFCDDSATWIVCGVSGIGEISIADDEMYRKFLMVRRYQMLALYDLESLTEACRIFWGDTATVLDAGHGRVVIAPGRDLTQAETALLQLYPRVLPVAPGVRIRFHFGPTKVFGFGEGWGGFCEPPADPAEAEGVILITEIGAELVTETGEVLTTGPLNLDAPWMCEVDPHPYDCDP